MTAATPSPATFRAGSVDRVRLIRRSMRCFLFGALGLVPLLGLGFACLALLLRRQDAEETRAPARLTIVNKYSITAFVLAFILLCYGETSLTLALGVLLSIVQGLVLLQEYRRAEPAEWNPARHLLYWGAALSYAGLYMSATIIMLNLEAVFERLAR